MIDGILHWLHGKSENPEHRGQAESLLNHIEFLGMKPPSVSEEDRQAIISVYYAGYTFNQWDEDLLKDEKVQAARLRRKKYREEAQKHETK
jgi:hypothetical protein